MLLIGGVWYLIAGAKPAGAPETSSTGTPETSSVVPKEATGTVEKLPEETLEAKTGEVVVAIQNFAFDPKTVTVKKGTKVTWTNQDSVGHTVTSDTGSELNSKLLAKGESFSHVFATVGTYTYHCTPHPNMKATVIVE